MKFTVTRTDFYIALSCSIAVFLIGSVLGKGFLDSLWEGAMSFPAYFGFLVLAEYFDRRSDRS